VFSADELVRDPSSQKSPPYHNHSTSLSAEQCVSLRWLAGGKFRGMDGVTPEGGGRGSHGFWGPGESTTGVERPSTLMEGMCTCALPLDGNWKESLAGLRGAIGLRVLQK
jgi:hypothetical protein